MMGAVSHRRRRPGTINRHLLLLRLSPLVLFLVLRSPSIHANASTTTIVVGGGSKDGTIAANVPTGHASSSPLTKQPRPKLTTWKFRGDLRRCRSDETSPSPSSSSSLSSPLLVGHAGAFYRARCPISPLAPEQVARGGGGSSSQLEISPIETTSTTTTTTMMTKGRGKRNANVDVARTISYLVATVLLVSIVVDRRELLASTLSGIFDANRSRAFVVRTMNDVASRGNVGLVLYAVGFALWEACGLPTSVVETAAGVAFGYRRGLACSFAGKTCGSCLAFILGRTLLSEYVHGKIGNTEPFRSIIRGAGRNPVRAAFVVRYSVFPQAIKNFGMALTMPVSFRIFLLSAMVHGLPFSVLWAALGDDAGSRLRSAELGEGTMPANVILNGLLAFVTIFGFVVSPTITGLWLADLRRVESRAMSSLKHVQRKTGFQQWVIDTPRASRGMTTFVS